ncbi:ABC transporter, permease protein (cluster 9, phospholipid) [hydrothermal vent metagenome]|uniref:ABC transporter, permease protein (Cluster 9, phospholipid) n=1 Tax=hydrothermal vent metagenome TaxID=652676 RepID=A0A3B0S712_9ZZZZ
MGNVGLQLNVEERGANTVVTPMGDWLVLNLAEVDQRLRDIDQTVDAKNIVFNLSSLNRIDMAGAFALSRLISHSENPDIDFHFEGEHPYARTLMLAALENSNVCPMPPRERGFHDLLIRVGCAVRDMLEDLIGTLAFAGRLFQTLWGTIRNPKRLRWPSVVSVAEDAGVNALPIVLLLSFFMGAVMAFLSANMLSRMGMSLFTVDLVGVMMLRELAVVISAVILAGRSNSAFTAQIGAMKMRQEIDAMDVLGIDPFEALVVPRVIACVFMIPLLVFAAMISGIFGGALVAWAQLGISPGMFISRLYEVIEIQHFWVGISKAPVFALIIALIGCRQGLLVENNVQSLGRRTTLSVVQALFAVILVDAIFALVYMELDI